MKIGVFDSGIGGEAVASSLRLAFPDAAITTINDREHLPYGDKSQEELIILTDQAIQPFLESGTDAIVIACNSATAAAIETLRKKYSDQIFVGLEPMVKPAAALTKTGVVTVCATPATLASDRYKRLKDTYAKDIEVYEPDCSSWARMIENNKINETTIISVIEASKARNADVIVLACTHYHWIRELIEKHSGTAKVIDPTEAVITQLHRLLS